MKNNKRYYYQNHNKKNGKYYYQNHNKKKNRNNKDFYQKEQILENDKNILLDVACPIKKIIPESTISIDSNLEDMDFVPQKKKKVSFIKNPFLKYGILFMILVIFIFSVSYSFFTYYSESNREANISAADIYVKLLENKVTLSLSKMYPMTATEARARNDNYVTFTLDGKNTSTTRDLIYSLLIENGDNVSGKTRIAPAYVNFDLEELVSGNYISIISDTPLSSFSFRDRVLPETNTEVERSFRLRVWVNDSVLISDTEPNATYTEAEFANLYATYSISVTSNDAQNIPTISSCPDCKFMYTTNTYYYGGANNVNSTTVSNIPEGVVKEDYREVISSSGKNYFLGFTESNGKIDRAFACGIKGEDPNEGTIFCIEGTSDSSKYSDNVNLVTGSTLWNDADFTANRCSSNTSDISCNGLVGTTVSLDGYVNVGSSGNYCYVHSLGDLHCVE